MNALGTPIAVGRTAEIFPWKDGCVLKLIRPGFSAYLADQEWIFAHAAWKLGARAPKPIELLEIDGRRGVVFKRIEGLTMARHIMRSIFLQTGIYARLLARLHAELHTLSVPTFLSQSERIRRNLDQSELLSEDQKLALSRLLDNLPDDDCLCHGDFHPDNIIMAKDGPLIIDWESSTKGNPATDVAHTCVLLRSALQFDTGIIGWIKSRIGRWFERAYLAEYNRVAPGHLDRLDDWIALEAASHLHEHTRREIEFLLPMIERGIQKAATLTPPSNPGI